MSAPSILGTIMICIIHKTLSVGKFIIILTHHNQCPIALLELFLSFPHLHLFEKQPTTQHKFTENGLQVLASFCGWTWCHSISG